MYLDIVFPKNVHPADMEIIRAATADEPGEARLSQARTETAASGWRVYSSNGGALIGIATGEATPPYDTVYELGTEEAAQGAASGPNGKEKNL